MENINDLKQFSLLCNLTDEELKDFSTLLKEEIFMENTNIITEDNVGSKMYFLMKGKVEILKTTMFGDKFACAILDDSIHGFFGEMALIDNDKRSATVLALSECKTLSITQEDFKTYCNMHPNAGVHLLFMISNKLVKSLRKENDNLKLVYQALIEEIENK